MAALRARFPTSPIKVLGSPRFTPLAVAGKLADGASSLEARSLAGLFARDGEWAEEVSRYFAQFDLIISYLSDPEKIFQTNVARCSKARLIAGPHRPDETVKLHATKVFLQPLEPLGITNPDSTPRITLHSPLSTHHVLALHPGSGSERKNWPENKWAELLGRLATETKWDFLLIGGEAEGDRIERLAATLPTARVQATQNLPLVELAERMKSCAFFLGHDSGITHLAAALGLSGLALWGETVPEIWQTLGGRIKLLRDKNGIWKIPVETVFRLTKSGGRANVLPDES